MLKKVCNQDKKICNQDNSIDNRSLRKNKNIQELEVHLDICLLQLIFP
jgi:hypothetical protein